MTGQSPLRRWKPYFAAFGLVDAAIEAAGAGICRDEIRSSRGEVVELLCGVPAGAEAEELCLILDGFMAESLLTLQAVPADAVPRVLASSADLAKAVTALRVHQSERVRRLARDVVRGWNVAVEDGIARASAAMEKLDDVCRVKAAEASRPLPNKITPVAGSRKTEITKARTTIPESPPPKRTPPSVGRAMRESPEEKMEATKRKLREGYQEVEDAKRQRKIQVIQAPKMLEQKQRKMHPILRERSQARCGRNSVVGRCLFSSIKSV